MGLRIATLVTGVAALVFLLFESWAIGILLLLVTIALGAAMTLSHNLARMQGHDLDELDPRTRMLIRPIQKLRNQLSDIVLRSINDSAVGLVGQEALIEAEAILEHAFRLGKERDAALKVLKEGADTAWRAEKAERALGEANNEAMAELLKTARQDQVIKINSLIGQIDERLTLAEASLAELVMQFRSATTVSSEITSRTDEMGELVGRLKSLGNSLGEVEEMIKESRQ